MKVSRNFAQSPPGNGASAAAALPAGAVDEGEQAASATTAAAPSNFTRIPISETDDVGMLADRFAKRQRRGLLLERDEHFGGMRDVEILAHQLVDHVRIGMLRIEQVDAVAQLGTVLVERGQLGLALRQLALDVAISERAVRSQDRIAAEERADDQQRRRRAGAAQHGAESRTTLGLHGKRFSQHPSPRSTP